MIGSVNSGGNIDSICNSGTQLHLVGPEVMLLLRNPI